LTCWAVITNKEALTSLITAPVNDLDARTPFNGLCNNNLNFAVSMADRTSLRSFDPIADVEYGNCMLFCHRSRMLTVPSQGFNDVAVAQLPFCEAGLIAKCKCPVNSVLFVAAYFFNSEYFARSSNSGNSRIL
jgi:hypothetical protein